MFIHEFLVNNINKYPEKTALICGDQKFTYKQLDDKAGRFTTALSENGINKGDRIVIITPNSVETIIAIFGILKIGGIFTIVHHSIKEKKLAYILDDCGAKAIILTQNQISVVGNALKSNKLLKCIIVSEEIDEGHKKNSLIFSYSFIQKNYLPWKQSPQLSENDLACLVYTSGSTGNPKGVMESHENIDFVTSSIIKYLENTSNDIIINSLPLSFDYGLYQVFMVFKFGGTLVLEKSFMFPGSFLKKIEIEKVNGLPVVPTMIALLLQINLSQYDLTSLRYITSTAAALPIAHIERLCAQFPWIRFYSMYGLTECKRALFLPPKELTKHPGSVGIPIPGTKAWIQDSNGNILSPGNIGELVVTGRHVMKGYWHLPEESALTFHCGRCENEAVLFTGDLFRQDNEGFFYFISRKDDIIKTRGEKVAPKEIEDILYLLPCIQEAAIVGVPDDIEGESIKACIVTKDFRLSKKHVINHCKKYLETFMIPKYIEFWDILPKNSSGKISRKSLTLEHEAFSIS